MVKVEEIKIGDRVRVKSSLEYCWLGLVDKEGVVIAKDEKADQVRVHIERHKEPFWFWAREVEVIYAKHKRT